MMKRIAISFLMSAVLLTSCTSEKKSRKEPGETIDSSVVGKDTTSVDVRKDIKLGDQQKQAIPGRSKDSTSDESRQKD